MFPYSAGQKAEGSLSHTQVCAEEGRFGSRRELREVRFGILRSCLCVIMSVFVLVLCVADVCVCG